jgi:predicted HTH domain antitoxin
MKRTNILLTEKQHKKLKQYAKKEGKTLGKMVREAVDQTYKKKDSLEKRKQIAIDAYKEGFISFGKLAEVLGLDPVSARIYLKDRNIPLQHQDLQDISQDVANA